MSLIMNPEDLLSLRGKFDAEAGEVDRLRSSIQGALDGTVWQSPAADQFRNIWSSDFVPALNRLQEALVQAASGVQNSHDKVTQANSAI